jgi:hypothetical protein
MLGIDISGVSLVLKSQLFLVTLPPMQIISSIISGSHNIAKKKLLKVAINSNNPINTTCLVWSLFSRFPWMVTQFWWAGPNFPGRNVMVTEFWWAGPNFLGRNVNLDRYTELTSENTVLCLETFNMRKVTCWE